MKSEFLFKKINLRNHFSVLSLYRAFKMCGIIFVERRSVASVLYHFLKVSPLIFCYFVLANNC